ncbi:MAG: nucleotidyltransferase domain-containing protein [Deltaproteobacteria bacterium]|nr:nucleotidyltransferase domain-containing protein [Deltaproteobacteria bacterium]
MREEILNKVKETVLKLEPSAEVILYGSRSRDDYRDYSDWDFLILLDGEVDTKRTDAIRNSLYEIELNTDQIISSIVRSRQEWNSPKYSVVPLRRNIEREGIRI